jgi:tetratricopeptide (TPR) repeat protein
MQTAINMSRALEILREQTVTSALFKAKLYEKKGKLGAAYAELERVSGEVGNRGLSSHAALCSSLVKVCCSLGKERTPTYLRRADEVLRVWKDDADLDYRRLTMLTLNSWAAYHRKQSSLHSAMKYLIQALKVPISPEDPDLLETLARTQLNTATLNNDLGKHKASVHFCNEALTSLNKEQALREKASETGGKGHFKRMRKAFVWTYLNLGQAEKALGRKGRAVEALRRAVRYAEEFLSLANPLVSLCREALQTAEAMPEGPPLKSLKPISAANFKLQLAKFEASIKLPSTPGTTEEPRLQSLPGVSIAKSDISLPTINAFQEEERYYSPERLSQLNKKLNSTNPRFINADLYFYRRLNKQFHVDDDVKHMRQANTALNSSKSEDQKQIFELKRKRHPVRMENELRGAEFIDRRLDLLQREAIAEAKRAEVKQKSRSISAKQKKTVSFSSKICSAKSFTSLPKAKVSQKVCITAKEEIEGLMETISKSLKQTHIQKQEKTSGRGLLAMSSAKLVF